jgi:hypothetical protein
MEKNNPGCLDKPLQPHSIYATAALALERPVKILAMLFGANQGFQAA